MLARSLPISKLIHTPYAMPVPTRSLFHMHPTKRPSHPLLIRILIRIRIINIIILAIIEILLGIIIIITLL
jgi:hypothetical protein